MTDGVTWKEDFKDYRIIWELEERRTDGDDMHRQGSLVLEHNQINKKNKKNKNNKKKQN